MEFFKRKLDLSTISVLFSIFIILWVNHNFSYWKKKNKVIEWDIISYYSYLPAFFTYHDLRLKFHKYEEEDLYIMWPKTLENGEKLIKTTMGLSFMYLPFFLMAHGFSYITGLPTTGYTPVYKYFLVISAIFYFLLGLIFVRKILKKYFNDKIVAITVIVLALGTNAYFYSTVRPPMPHVYLFFLFAVFIWLTIKWYENFKFTYAVLLGLTSGLITLIRPIDSLISIFFVLYGVSSFNNLKSRIQLFFRKSHHLLTILFFAFLVLVPQFLYWKMITGHYIYYSYGDERFFWGNPHIIDGLFSYRKGWLVYTPVMFFALIGIFFLKGKLKNFFVPTLLFTIINIYVIFSWWCWWYGGSFGQRAMIDSYPLMSIPLSAFTDYILQRKKIIKFSYLTVLFFFIVLNMFNTYQYIKEAIHYDGTTKELYWKYFGKYKVEKSKKDYWDLIKRPDYEMAKKGIYVDMKKKSK